MNSNPMNAWMSSASNMNNDNESIFDQPKPMIGDPSNHRQLSNNNDIVTDHDDDAIISDMKTDYEASPKRTISQLPGLHSTMLQSQTQSQLERSSDSQQHHGAPTQPIASARQSMPTQMQSSQMQPGEQHHHGNGHGHHRDSEPGALLSRSNSTSGASKYPTKVIVDWKNLEKFLALPCSNRRSTFQTQIIRNKSGIANKLYPQYEVFLKDSSKVLMIGKKQAGSKTSNYYISTNSSHFDSNINNNSNSNNSKDGKDSKYLAKVRSNFAGTEFIVYDNGRSPKDMQNPTDLRCELACVMYETNILGTKGPRKMHVLIPDMKSNGEAMKLQPTGADSLMLTTYRQKIKQNIRLLQNKSPKWNEQIGAYVLNFDGRVTMASVKNFQLVFENSQDVILQFGRIGKDKFTMDFKYPLSPIQAFGICLSSFDNKLACE